jgi:Zn-dependent protease
MWRTTKVTREAAAARPFQRWRAGYRSAMFSNAVRVATIRGIEVRLDPTLVVLAALIVWTFAARFAAEHGWPAGVAMGLAGMVLFLGSILAHELAHALEARHRDIEVDSITLLIFGGVTQMHAHSSRPRDEFAIAAVGPFVSLLCGAVFGLASLVTTEFGWAAPTQVLRLLAALNVVLAIFNLVPGAPLDGGRVLRAGLWAVFGDRSRAIRVAARCGQALGVAIVGVGIWVAFRAQGAALAALWYLAIGGFLYWAAGSEHRNSRLDDLYTGTTVREVVALGREHPRTRFPLEPVSPTDRVGASGSADGAGGSADGSHSRRDDDSDSDSEVARLPEVDLDADLHDLVEAFQGDTDRVLLTEQGRPVGSVEERYVARAVALLRNGHRPAPQPTPPADPAPPPPAPSTRLPPDEEASP